jgi:membrane protein
VYDRFQAMLFANLMPTQSEAIIEHINRFIANADKLGLIGVFYVVFAVVMFFKDYDFIVNDIFELPRRGVMRSIRTYLFLLVAAPTMAGASFYLSVKLQTLLDSSEATKFIHLYYFVPYLIVWGLFYIAYQLSARKRIDPKAALASSFIASLIWYGGKSLFVFYVLHNKTYATVYGSVSTLIFFFLWIYISWAIFLHGLRLCHLLDKGVDFDRV